jgi:predicted nucleic acid-binding protein
VLVLDTDVISHDAILLTGNARDFEKIPMLKLIPIAMQ